MNHTLPLENPPALTAEKTYQLILKMVREHGDSDELAGLVASLKSLTTIAATENLSA